MNGTPRRHHWEPHPCHLLHLSGSPRSQLGRVQDRHVAGGARRDPAEEWATGTPGAMGGPGGERLVPSGIWVPRPWRQRLKGIQEAQQHRGAGVGAGPAPEQAPGSLQDWPPQGVPPHPESPGASHSQKRDNIRLTLLSQDGVGDQPLALPVQGLAWWLGATHLPPCPSAPGQLAPSDRCLVGW